VIKVGNCVGKRIQQKTNQNRVAYVKKEPQGFYTLYRRERTEKTERQVNGKKNLRKEGGEQSAGNKITPKEESVGCRASTRGAAGEKEAFTRLEDFHKRKGKKKKGVIPRNRNRVTSQEAPGGGKSGNREKRRRPPVWSARHKRFRTLYMDNLPHNLPQRKEKNLH